jgi:hypothetical protein
MTRCRICCIPPTRPDTPFVDGICSACHSHANRPKFDWNARKRDLVSLLDRHDGRCIVPSSGGKDSHYQALTLLELGAKPIIVTASTCHLTDIGRYNIDNLARYATTLEITPKRSVRAKLNRLGLEMVGDISWPEHASIFTTPFRAAKALGIDLIFYGESPQNQYGGPSGTEDARQMTRQWVHEFGGFLGLRPQDFIGTEGITEDDMKDYMMPEDLGHIEAHFLGQYIEWDSHRNATVAKQAGMKQGLPTFANWWPAENVDNAQTGLHDQGMYRKYGYGRLCAQVSVDVRMGRMGRDYAMSLVEERDGVFPYTYAGVSLSQLLERIQLDRNELFEILDKFTNWSLFDHVENNRPILKEFVWRSQSA